MSPSPYTSTCLNGEWQFCPLANPTPLETLPVAPAWESEPLRVPSSWRWSFDVKAEFQPYDLFGYPAAWNDAPAGLLRRKFVADQRPGERTWLIFHGVLQRWQVFVNGQSLPLQNESYLPVEFDVTDLLRPGENELTLWCGPWERIPTETGDKVIVPNGSWFAGLARGPWQDVFVETRPAAWIRDVFVQTSVRQGKIVVEVTVENRGDEIFRGSVKAVIPNASPVLEQGITISKGESATVRLESPWADAHLWSPENPHLYSLETTLENGTQINAENADQNQLPRLSASIRVQDSQITRFGFREIWIEGDHFVLNGTRLNPRGDAWHYQGFVYQTPDYARNWYRASKETGVNFIRLHAQPYPEFFLDVADEEGMLIVDESAIYGSSKATLSDDPRFLSNCRAHLERLVRRDRNHPSVIVWSLQNEMRWVDGRDGYCAAIPGLTAAMRTLDPTRPISYDGDNRLVPAEWCDIISMHYNIDGTIEGWRNSLTPGPSPAGRGEKPLIFGEHGPYHYISPQTCTDLGGPEAYTSYERCLWAIGENERLFLEYARREGAAVTPFNIVHYSHWTLPAAHTPLAWERLDTPGPKPRRIPAHTLTIHNGLVDAPRHLPNPAYEPVQRAFQPVAFFADELDTHFYAGPLNRHFSIYNDTERPAHVRLVWSLADGEKTVQTGETAFAQPPGERVAWEHTFNLPIGHLTLAIQLYHGNELRAESEFTYTIHAPIQPLDAAGKRIAYLGEASRYARLRQWLTGLESLAQVDAASLEALDVLVIGAFYRAPAGIQAPLGEFVARGGVLIVLEQDQFTLGELSLSGRKFFSAFPNPPEHPIFAGLSAEDLRFWTPDNPHSPGWNGLVRNAFHKPSQGDLEILLECGEGYFGWGGLLWTPLVAYRHGAGRAICCQVALEEYADTVPQAAILLRNLLAYALTRPQAPSAQVINLDPDDPRLPALLDSGATILLNPVEPRYQGVLRQLTGLPIVITEAPTYQLAKSLNHPITQSLTAFDLSLLERVTYTPPSYSNRLIARHALEIPGAQPLFESVHAPWEDYFVRGKDGEPIKMAVATLNRIADFTPAIYAAVLPVGKGQLVFCQVLKDVESPKIQRIYNRLLANLGAEIRTELFSHQKQATDYGIEAFMGLGRAEHQDLAAMTAYFTDENYALNNLGEGVYGWMVRLEKRDGVINIPNSAGQTWFLTCFIESEINRDPEKRASGVLPDSSIVPDLFIEANCSVQLFVNGRDFLDAQAPSQTSVKVEDIPLRQGINRLALVCRAAGEDIRLNAWFMNKYAEPVPGLRYPLTLD
jgi:hypothetical protein